MMRAKDHRANARAALKGRWGVAVLTGILVGLLTGGLTSGVNMSGNGQELGLQQVEAINQLVWMGVAFALVYGLVMFLIGGAVEMGYAHFNLRLIDREEVRVGHLFGEMNRIGAGICMVLLRALYFLVWMLPFIALIAAWYMVGYEYIMSWTQLLPEDIWIALAAYVYPVLPVILIVGTPMLIATYRYLLMPYLMAENPGMRAREAIRLSKTLMHGYKWKAFCLQLSFFGWTLLVIFTFGIAGLWVNPYMAAANASFYREVCRQNREEQPQEAVYLNRGPEL